MVDIGSFLYELLNNSSLSFSTCINHSSMLVLLDTCMYNVYMLIYLLHYPVSCSLHDSQQPYYTIMNPVHVYDAIRFRYTFLDLTVLKTDMHTHSTTRVVSLYSL